jgi:hypothetical protein
MNLTQHLRGLSRLDIYFARLIAGIAAVCEIYYIAEREYRIYKFFQAGGEALFDPRYAQMHLRIAVALLLSAVCLWSRGAWFFYVSLACAIWVVVEYAGWYVWSRRILSYAEIPTWPPGTKHALGLGDATGLNVVVLLLTLVLLLWQTKTLLRTRLYRHVAV